MAVSYTVEYPDVRRGRDAKIHFRLSQERGGNWRCKVGPWGNDYLASSANEAFAMALLSFSEVLYRRVAGRSALKDHHDQTER